MDMKTTQEVMDLLPEQPTAKEVKQWDADELLRWIQQTSPKMLKNDNHLEKFKVAYISGQLFLMKAGRADFFEKKCYLPVGPSEELAELASDIARGETSKLLSFIYLYSSLLSSFSLLITIISFFTIPFPRLSLIPCSPSAPSSPRFFYRPFCSPYTIVQPPLHSHPDLFPVLHSPLI
jgi:hypothetical protein